MDKPTIHQKLDACRPSHDDHLSDEMADVAQELEANPELQRQFDHSQRLDTSIASAYAQVDVPEGLASQIMSRLEEGPRQAVDDTIQENSAADVQDEVPKAATPTPAQRRGWLVASASALVAAALLVVAFAWLWEPNVAPTLQQLLAAAEQASDSLQDDAWKTDGEPLHADNVLPKLRRGTKIHGWQPVKTPFGKAMAYNLTRGNGNVSGVMLRIPIKELPTEVQTRFPQTPQSPSGRPAIGVCRDERFVFILVTDRNAYKQFIPSGSII